MIQIIGPQLSQWDTGRRISVSGSNATHAHFANRGDSHAVIMELENGEAKIPDYLLQTGKDLYIYLVLDGITQESKTFPIRKRERPEDYVYEEDRRNYIYELITDAQTATEAANQAAGTANQAAQNAINATTDAEAATKNANEAAGKVNEAVTNAGIATQNANEAAARAAHTAKSLMVVGGASGAPIHLSDAIDQFVVGLRIFGKTTQDGTPTPEAPVDLVSVGDSGSITVNVTGEHNSQNVVVSTPNGLPGIPVASGGNYTDANGQQWICDEIDFSRGVYVKRIETYSYSVSNMNNSENYAGWTNAGIYKYYPSKNGNMDTHAIATMNNVSVSTPHINTLNGNDVVLIPDYNRMTQTEWKANYPDLVVKLIFPIPTPIETPLSEEELAAYRSLYTYKDNTTVSNDAGAWMELEYAVDAKKYIDSKIAGAILSATVE